MNILGISAFYHDSAAALLVDGRIKAAAQEERFTRKRHDSAFPAQAVEYCLREAGLKTGQIDRVAFYDKPLLKFERILTTCMAYAPRGFTPFRMALPLWIKKKLWMRDLIRAALPDYKAKVCFPEHHQSHAASAFYPSPFKDAAVLTMDGVGEWATSSIGKGEGRRLRLLKEMRFPHSLGMLYSAFTYYCGFKVNSGEYKLMGLAPYGKPRFTGIIYDRLIELKEDGSFKLDMRYFNYCAGLTMTNRRFNALFGEPVRKKESEISQFHKDVAASAQAVCEEVMLRMARHAVRIAGSRNLCLAGGVALNCVGNGRLIREGVCDQLWVQPAAGDAGGALGAALFIWHEMLGKPRRTNPEDSQRMSLLGPEFSDQEIEGYLIEEKIPFKKLTPAEIDLQTAKRLAKSAVIGWYQGRMEYGPRALGARSILGDARDPRMKDMINDKIKFRERFRPFAPAVMAEERGTYFHLKPESPYMLLVTQVRQGANLPAITHVDGSARVQTVSRTTHPRFHSLIAAFKKETGCAVIVNTSFNVRGEPIVCTPAEAYRCFMRTGIDFLVMGRCFLEKKEQPEWGEGEGWMKEYELD